MLKKEYKKDIEQGVLLQGLMKLINSNTENITKLVTSNMENLTSMMNTKKSEASPTPVSTDAGTNRVSKLTKPAKVPSWTKDMSLETYIKQLPNCWRLMKKFLSMSSIMT